MRPLAPEGMCKEKNHFDLYNLVYIRSCSDLWDDSTKQAIRTRSSSDKQIHITNGIVFFFYKIPKDEKKDIYSIFYFLNDCVTLH